MKIERTYLDRKFARRWKIIITLRKDFKSVRATCYRHKLGLEYANGIGVGAFIISEADKKRFGRVENYGWSYMWGDEEHGLTDSWTDAKVNVNKKILEIFIKKIIKRLKRIRRKSPRLENAVRDIFKFVDQYTIYNPL